MTLLLSGLQLLLLRTAITPASTLPCSGIGTKTKKYLQLQPWMCYASLALSQQATQYAPTWCARELKKRML
jgi:hypothetical protein